MFGLVPVSARAEQYRLVTIAGGGLGEGRKATDVSLEPGGIAVDARKDVLVSDVSRHRIVRIDPQIGTVRTLVGNGVPGCLTGEAVATKAVLNHPRGLFLTREGGLYVANVGCRCFSRIDLQSGTVTRVAALDAYDSPNFAVDGEDRLLVIDEQRHRIKRLDPRNGSVVSIAGTGERLPNGDGTFSGDGSDAASAGLNQPRDLAVDESGNVYVADSGNRRIRVISVRGSIRSLAVPESVAEEAFGSNRLPFYVSVNRNGQVLVSAGSRIWRIEPETGKTRLLSDLKASAGTGDSGQGLRTAAKVAVSPNGTLYAVDWRTEVVFKVDPMSGSSTRFAGGGPRSFDDGASSREARLDQPGALAVDPTGEYLYFAEQGAQRIRRVSLADGSILPVAGERAARAGTPGIGRSLGDGLDSSTAVLRPASLVFDTAGNLYVADSLHHRVRRIDRSSHVVTTIAGTGDSESSGDNGPARQAGLAGPGSIAFDPSGNFYVSDRDGIRSISPSGTISTVEGTSCGSRRHQGEPTCPGLLAVDSAGNVYFMELTVYGDAVAVRKIDARTRAITALLGGDSLRYEIFRTVGLAIDADGRLYLSDGQTSQIRRFDPATGQLSMIASKYDAPGEDPDEPPLDMPTSLTVDRKGNVYFSEHRSNKIRCLQLVSPE